MPTLNITWITAEDDRVCPICQSLDRWTWTFTDEMPNELIHPAVGRGGVVWDLVADESRAHGNQSYHCRCRLGFDIDDADVMRELAIVGDEVDGITHTLEETGDFVQMLLRFMRRIT